MVHAFKPQILRPVSPEIVQVTHFGQPALMERHPITVAKVRTARGERLHECVLVNLRYAQGHLSPSDYDIVTVWGYRDGRSIDVLLDVPFEHDGTLYGILNFKGAGARALDEDPYGFIHPTKWYDLEKGLWVPMEDADPHFMRCFGALRRREAYYELRDALLPSFGIPQLPHVAANPFPPALNRAIYRIAGERPRHRFSQLVRAFHTNIRMDEKDAAPFGGLSEDAIKTKVMRLAEIDMAFVNAQLHLARKGLRLGIIGAVCENRFYSGEVTDAENWVLRRFVKKTAAGFVAETVLSSIGLIVNCFQSVSEGQCRDLLVVYFNVASEVFDQRFVGEYTKYGPTGALERVFSRALTKIRSSN